MSDALEQIRKLLRLANNAGATQGEVQAALGRAAHLAAKHNISDVEIERATRADGSEGVRIHVDPEDMDRQVIWGARSLSRWDKWILGAIAKASGTGAYIGWHAGQPALWLYGLPADIAVGAELFAFARAMMSKCCRSWAKEQRESGLQWVQGNCRETRSYKDGFCSGLHESAKRQQNEGERVQLGTGETSALVLVQDVREAKQQAVAKYSMRLGLGRARKARARTTCSSSRSAGYTRGSATNLTRDAVK